MAVHAQGRTRWTGLWLAGLAVVALTTLPACTPRHPCPVPDDAVDFSADQLDLADDVVLDGLEPEEREAVERSGISHAASAPDAGDSKSDTAGKVGLSVLSVAMTIGAVVAPFFLL